MRKIAVNINGISKLIAEELLVEKTIVVDEVEIHNGYYDNYLNEIVDGKYIVDTVKEAEMEAEELMKEIKTNKDLSLDSLVVEVNTVPFDADNQSINYMSSVLAVANFKYNQAVSLGADAAITYEAIYKTIIQWKNANNTVSDVQLETVAEALEASMNAVGSIKKGD